MRPPLRRRIQTRALRYLVVGRPRRTLGPLPGRLRWCSLRRFPFAREVGRPRLEHAAESYQFELQANGSTQSAPPGSKPQPVRHTAG
jgi:hypothetical protein